MSLKFATFVAPLGGYLDTRSYTVVDDDEFEAEAEHQITETMGVA